MHFQSIAILVLATIAYCHGHAILTQPKARAGMDVGIGAKITPRPPTLENLNNCPLAGVMTPAGPIAAVYAPGSTMDVKWSITLDHDNAPGVRIAIGYPGEPAYRVLAEAIDVHLNQTTVTLPADPCPNCVLHWMWDSTLDAGYYVGCSDIAIQSDPSALPVVSPVVIPTTTNAVATPVAPAVAAPVVARANCVAV